MTSEDSAAIGDSLRRVSEERRLREAEAGLAERVAAIKRFQHARFAHTYGDVLSQPRYAPAARFFLDELYGPHDFSDRDAQFARIVPALTRLFPHEIVATVRDLAQLHALSETLDSAMARAAPAEGAVGVPAYLRAWQMVGRRDARLQQVELMLAVGHDLERYTRRSLLRQTLRLMRAPARAAGLAALQGFLESGFDTFRALGGAQAFLSLIAVRERSLIDAMFAIDLADEAAVSALEARLVSRPPAAPVPGSSGSAGPTPA